MAAKMEALHGLLRLYGIRMDYADDLGNAEADYELQEAIDRSSERCALTACQGGSEYGTK